jgi:hypothetical protein
VSPFRVVLVLSAFGSSACSSNSAGGGSVIPGDQDGAVDSASTSASTDAPAEGAEDTQDAGSSPAGTAAAGKAGVDAYCQTLCEHEQRCSAIDAGAAALAACVSEFQTFYEATGANPWGGNPPLELYRADYVAGLGSCINESPCPEGLSASETRCSADLVGGVDGGAPVIAPTTALSTLCRAFGASTCLAADAGSQNCTSDLMLYNDGALTAAASCLTGSSSCSTVSSCFAGALTQR